MTDAERVDKFYGRIMQRNMGSYINAFDLVYDNIYVGSTPRDDGTFPSVDAVLNLRAESQLTLNCKATLWMPIWDRPPFPGVDWLKQAVAFLDMNQQNGWTTYVHCNAGLSRSGMVMVAFVMKKESLPMEKAWEVVCSKRPTAPNPSFCLGLVEYERHLQGKD